MIFEHELTQVLHAIRTGIAIAQHHFNEWIRTEIIDDDPYDVEIWRNEQCLIAAAIRVKDHS